MVEIVFSKHAVEQMLKRRVVPDEVQVIVSLPDGVVVQSRDKRVVYKRFPKRNDNLIAAVIVYQATKIIEVITVMHNFEVRT